MSTTAEDVTTVATVAIFVKDWGFVGLLVGGFSASGAFIWRTSAKVTKALGHIDLHAERIDKVEVRVDKTETAQQAAEVKFAAMPTHADITGIRQELSAAMASLQSQLQSGFSQMMQLFSARPH